MRVGARGEGGLGWIGWIGWGWVGGWRGGAHDGRASQCCRQGGVSYDSGSHAAHPSHASVHSSAHGGGQRGALPTAWATRAQPARHASPRTPTHAAPLACARPSSREAFDSSSSSQKASCRSVYWPVMERKEAMSVSMTSSCCSTRRSCTAEGASTSASGSTQSGPAQRSSAAASRSSTPGAWGDADGGVRRCCAHGGRVRARRSARVVTRLVSHVGRPASATLPTAPTMAPTASPLECARVARLLGETRTGALWQRRWPFLRCAGCSDRISRSSAATTQARAELGCTGHTGSAGAHMSFFWVCREARTPRQRSTEQRVRRSSSQPATVTRSARAESMSTPSHRSRAAAGAGGTPL